MKEASRSSVSPLEFIILVVDGFLVLFIAVATLSAASRLSDAAIERAAESGANNFVAGSAVFKAEDAAAEVDALRELAHGAAH